MAKVGMHKQQKYEEGVQKIQSDIEKIAGLDIMRDVDKAYLQSKLNQLGSNLRPFMASDFSDFQLQNSVAGMTSAIGDDPNIQTAVNSTAFYRKQKELMEKAISEGKSAVQNQWDFSLKVNDYLQNPELGQSFNGRYTDYIDVEKKWLEVFKNLHPDLAEQDIPYVRNEDGTLNYNKTAAAMQRVSKETVSAAKIENALRASMSPDELNQLSIDGRYQFRGYDTPEKLAVYSQTRYQKYFDELNSREEKLKALEVLNSSNPAELEKTKNALTELQETRVKLTDQMNQEIEVIKSNPEQAKASIYKNQAIAAFANAYSWETNKINLLENPILKAEQWERNFQFDREKHNWTKFKDQHSMAMAEKEYALKYEKQMAELYGISGEFEAYGGLSTKVDDPVVALQNDINTKDQRAGSILNELSTIKINGSKANKEYWAKQIAEYEKTQDLSLIPATARPLVEEYIKTKKEATNLKAGVKKAEEEALNDPEVKRDQEKVKAELSQVPIQGMNVTVDGEVLSFSREEIFDYLSKTPSYYSKNNNPFGTGVVPKSWTTNYTEKQKKLYRYFNRNNDGNNKNVETIKKTFKLFDGVVKDNFYANEKYEEKVKKLLLERTTQYLPVVSNITVGSEEGSVSRAKYEGIAMSLLMTYGQTVAGMRGGTPEMTPQEIEKYRGWLDSEAGKKNLQYKMLTQGDKTYLMVIKGNEEALIPVPIANRYMLPSPTNVPGQNYKKVQAALNLGDGNTNPSGLINNSYYTSTDFPNVSGLGVTADLQRVKGEENKVLINLNIKLDSGWKSLQIDNYPMDVNAAEQFVKSASNSVIKQIFLERPDVPQAWKEEIKKIK